MTMKSSAPSRRRIAVLAIVLLSAAAGVQAQAFADVKKALVDYSKADIAPRKSCDTMSKFKAKEIVEIHSSAIAAAAGVPAHCRVTGTLAPEIAFEVSLPEKWNGRFYTIGNGGLAGENMQDPGRVSQRNAALQVGFAFAQTNTGHDSQKEPSGTFVMKNPQKAIDYAYRAVHLTAVTTKDITKDYYGRGVSKAYWNSCSNGGRQGLLEAERYPEDFNGIVANAPWVDQTGFTIGAIWNQQALSAAPVSAAKLAMVATKVMGKCDASDGLKDGVIDDPRKCSFDAMVDVPQCKAGADTSDCLTYPQADAIMKVWGGPVSNGKQFFPGYMRGSEANWMNLVVAAQAGCQTRRFQPGGRNYEISGADAAQA